MVITVIKGCFYYKTGIPTDFLVNFLHNFILAFYMKPAELTQTISDTLTDLRKPERKVADFVLNNLLQVIRMRIVDLAQEANVSEPTVVRFCRAVGCQGFQDFKLALAQQLDLATYHRKLYQQGMVKHRCIEVKPLQCQLYR